MQELIFWIFVNGTLSIALEAVFAKNEFSVTELWSVNIMPSISNAAADLNIAPTFCGSSSWSNKKIIDVSLFKLLIIKF